MLNALQKRLKGKKAHNKAVFCSANRFGRAAAEKRRDPVFKPQGNSIIPKRKFVMTFQKRRARRGAPFCARRGAKAVNKKRRGRVYAGRGKWYKVKVRRLVGKRQAAALSLRSVRRRGAKSVNKKRHDRVYAGRGKRCGRLGSVSAVLSSCQLCAHICFAHNFGGAG